MAGYRCMIFFGLCSGLFMTLSGGQLPLQYVFGLAVISALIYHSAVYHCNMLLVFAVISFPVYHTTGYYCI